jgi:hypothetical protein
MSLLAMVLTTWAMRQLKAI